MAIDEGIHPYYRDRAQSILDEMVDGMQLVRDEFEVCVPDRAFADLIKIAKEELHAVLPFLPYAGGDSGRMTPYFKLGAGVIAVGRMLRRIGASAETISAMMRRVSLAKIAILPKERRFAIGREWLSKENQHYLLQQATVSQRRENEDDFVYEFVENNSDGSAESYSFGIDYTECGFCKMCAASGDEDLLPVLCSVDKESYAIRGIELQRTTTLASGSNRCNFRFRPAQTVENSNEA